MISEEEIPDMIMSIIKDELAETNFIEQRAHRIYLYCLLAGIEIILRSINIQERPMNFVENILRKIGISPEELGSFPKKGGGS